MQASRNAPLRSYRSTCSCWREREKKNPCQRPSKNLPITSKQQESRLKVIVWANIARQSKTLTWRNHPTISAESWQLLALRRLQLERKEKSPTNAQTTVPRQTCSHGVTLSISPSALETRILSKRTNGPFHDWALVKRNCDITDASWRTLNSWIFSMVTRRLLMVRCNTCSLLATSLRHGWPGICVSEKLII